jgi:hypothetical protein
MLSLPVRERVRDRAHLSRAAPWRRGLAQNQGSTSTNKSNTMTRRPRLLRPSRLFHFGLACALGAIAWPAASQGARPAAVFVQLGGGGQSVQAASIGLLWPWAWHSRSWGERLSAHTEVFVSHWRARDFDGGYQGFVQLGVVPYLRYRPGNGQSPWFFEGGIGVSALNKRYVTPDKTFSTRLNFSDNLAVGRSFGDRREHEVSLRLQHTSNAGIKRPNPGEDLLLVRYSTSF